MSVHFIEQSRFVFVIWEPFYTKCKHTIRILDCGNFEVVCNHFSYDQEVIRQQVRNILKNQ